MNCCIYSFVTVLGLMLIAYLVGLSYTVPCPGESGFFMKGGPERPEFLPAETIDLNRMQGDWFQMYRKTRPELDLGDCAKARFYKEGD